MNREVFLSLLALDAYNRGYGQGILLEAGDNSSSQNETGRSIGLATVVDDANDIEGLAQDAGFYAIAYEWDGETIISYRGTNFPGGIANPGDGLEQIFDFFRDFFGGWSLFTGFTRPV